MRLPGPRTLCGDHPRGPVADRAGGAPDSHRGCRPHRDAGIHVAACSPGPTHRTIALVHSPSVCHPSFILCAGTHHISYRRLYMKFTRRSSSSFSRSLRWKAKPLTGTTLPASASRWHSLTEKRGSRFGNCTESHQPLTLRHGSTRLRFCVNAELRNWETSWSPGLEEPGLSLSWFNGRPRLCPHRLQPCPRRALLVHTLGLRSPKTTGVTASTAPEFPHS